MNRADRKRWKGARTLADLGGLVIAWLHGEIQQTPGHCGPPCDETIPLIPVLELVNRAGFVTDNSQLAETCEYGTWNTWVSGFAPDATLARLREAIAGTPLVLAMCRSRAHDCPSLQRLLGGCPWSTTVSFWAARCPAVARELHRCWYVTVSDPEPGCNDLLWPALAMFAALSQEAQS